MARRSEGRWPGLRRAAVEKAEILAWQAGKSLPTDLGKVATKCAVNRIEFRPLLTDGGMAVTENGFAIFVKADVDEGEQLTEQFAADGTGACLPKKIVRRARFTIAHEIAHTLFYDIRAMPPKQKVEMKSAASVKSLERVCNTVAGTLLLPESILVNQFARIDFCDPAELSRLADLALISKRALVLRLGEIRRLLLPVAIIACVGWRDGRFVIESIFRHYSLRQILSRAKMGAALSTLVDHPDFLPNAGDLPEVNVEISSSTGPLYMLFRCERSLRFGSRNSFFVTGTRSD